MEPAIPAGTRVLVDTEWDGMGPGDVVCFEDGLDARWTVHRVLGRFRLGRTRYFVQAPESGRAATVVSEKRIVGRVRGTERDYHRPLTASERLLAVRTILRHAAGGAVRRLLGIVTRARTSVGPRDS